MRTMELEEVLNEKDRAVQRAPRRTYNHFSNLEAYRSLAGGIYNGVLDSQSGDTAFSSGNLE